MIEQIDFLGEIIDRRDTDKNDSRIKRISLKIKNNSIVYCIDIILIEMNNNTTLKKVSSSRINPKVKFSYKKNLINSDK